MAEEGAIGTAAVVKHKAEAVLCDFGVRSYKLAIKVEAEELLGAFLVILVGIDYKTFCLGYLREGPLSLK